jgi:hypothetical protein
MGTSSDSGDLKLCTRCVGDQEFVSWIQIHGKRGKCDFDPTHGKSRKVVPVRDFAVEVDGYFRENYKRGEEYAYATRDSDNPSYDTRGSSYREILSNDLQADNDLIDAIVEHLPDADHAEIMDGGEPFYDDFSNYESLADVRAREQQEQEERWYERRFEYQWNDFCSVVQYERRFFKTKELLDALFGTPEEYDQGTIRPVYALEIGQTIYRARLLGEGLTEPQVAQNPAKELGAPPKDKARAGRMSVEYIPVFYGAFSELTAVAELRPSIGDQVAVAEFNLLKPLRVFDFTAFSQRGVPWQESYAHTRYDFITQMEDGISKPISPFERQREYIATQIVAEYLREYFNCDAIIYQSSMHKSDKEDNRNIVILSLGNDFIGAATPSSLTLARYNIRHIANVSYEISPIWF